jgi:Protein of unknown function (DUF2934)
MNPTRARSGQNKPAAMSTPPKDAPVTNGHAMGGLPMTILPEEIAERAHARFLARGGQHGRDMDDWFEAERALRFERLARGGSSSESS